MVANEVDLHRGFYRPNIGMQKAERERETSPAQPKFVHEQTRVLWMNQEMIKKKFGDEARAELKQVRTKSGVAKR